MPTDNNDNNKKSPSDELCDLLSEYRKNHNNGQSAQPAENKQSVRESLSQDDDDVKEYISASKPKSKQSSDWFEAPADSDGRENEIAGHFADVESGESDDISGVHSSHFSDAATPIPPIEEIKTDEQDDDDDESKNKVVKVAHKIGRLGFLVKAIVYIAVIFIVSAYLSVFVIKAGNDVFALVSTPREVVVTIPENATEKDVSVILKQKGLIEYDWVFELYMKYRSDNEITFVPGEHTLNADMNYTQLINEITKTVSDHVIVRITIPEGFTIDEMIDLFISNGMGTKEGYVEAINNYPYKHEFVRLLDETGYPETRKYRLEGYLYPDTYDFYVDTEEYLVINKLLNNFDTKFYTDFKAIYSEIATEQNLSLDDVVVLASMIQAEGKSADDYEFISYVFHNRLSHSSTYPKLESDATIQYVLPKRTQDMTYDEKNYDSPYNTYKNDGLPPGAICNPGLDSLLASLYPVKPVTESGTEINAYFFNANNAGKVYYSATLAGHNQNIAQAERDNAAIEAGTYEG